MMMKTPKHPRLILILTAIVSFGAGYLVAGNSRGTPPQFLAPSQPSAEAEAYVRQLTGAGTTYTAHEGKTWMPVNK